MSGEYIVDVQRRHRRCLEHLKNYAGISDFFLSRFDVFTLQIRRAYTRVLMCLHKRSNVFVQKI